MNRHRFKLTSSSPVFRYLASLLNCGGLLRLRRMVMRILPFMCLQSQVRNVVYLSWFVDIEQVRQRYPQHIPFWEKDGKTIFTILTYQHQHFGFSFLGKVRKMMPSPQQSNWRFYLDGSKPKTVLFEQVMVDQMLYVVGGRLASDVMPAQYASVFQHQLDERRDSIHTEISVDKDYALISEVQMTQKKQLPAAWQTLFAAWDDAVRFLVDQDYAWAEWVDQPSKMSQGEIKMPVQFEQIQAAEIIQLQAPQLLQQLGLDSEAEAFAFVVPMLDFYVIGEKPLNRTINCG